MPTAQMHPSRTGVEDSRGEASGGDRSRTGTPTLGAEMRYARIIGSLASKTAFLPMPLLAAIVECGRSLRSRRPADRGSTGRWKVPRRIVPSSGCMRLERLDQVLLRTNPLNRFQPDGCDQRRS